MKDATELRVLNKTQISNSIPIMRSTNEDNGIEFSYSTWIYKDVPKDGHYQNVFVKETLTTMGEHFADSGEFKGIVYQIMDLVSHL